MKLVEKIWVEYKRKSYSYKSISIWKTEAKGEECLLVKIPETNMAVYLIQTKLCK